MTELHPTTGNRRPPEWLFIIESDPRTSPRPAEAIRIAAGVAVWKNVTVRVYLRGAAVVILGKTSETLLDEDHFTQYLPLLAAETGSILVDASSPLLGEMELHDLPHRAVSIDEAALLAAHCSAVSRF